MSLDQRFQRVAESVDSFLISFSEEPNGSPRKTPRIYSMSSTEFPRMRDMSRSRSLALSRDLEMSEASDVMSELISVESEYRRKMTELRNTLTSLNKRGNSARRILDISPMIKQSEYDRLNKLESEIEKATAILEKSQLNEIVALNEQDLKMTESLERSNTERRRLISTGQLPARKPPMRHSRSHPLVKSHITSLFDKKGKISVDDVKVQIQQLIKTINERNLQHKREMQAIESLQQENLRSRVPIESSYAKKEARINELQKMLQEIADHHTEISNLENDLIDSDQFLRELIRKKQQTERQNFTTARDKHANSLAVQRLEEAKKRYEENTRAYEDKIVQMEQRRAKIAAQEVEVDKQSEKTDAYERQVALLEKKLADSGAAFSTKVSESQYELDAIDELAARRSTARYSVSIGDELVSILNDDSDPIDQL